MYNFNEVHDRKNTNCYKWDNNEVVYKIEDASDLLPMWIADMDIATPTFVIEAMQQRLEHPVFGYVKTPDSLYTAIIDWYKTRHHWTIEKENLLFHDGVIPAIAAIIETFTAVGDRVAISSPVYVPFTSIPTNLKREVVRVPLEEKNEEWIYNFETLEAAFQDGVSVYILCNPHNPGGYVWNEDTLVRILQLAKQYDVLVISDEIHCDLVLAPYKHIALQTLNETIGADIITCLSPTKTFNLASVQFAMMVTSNKDLTAKLQRHALVHGRFAPNIFGMVATEAAFAQGADWVDGLLEHLAGNIDYVIEACRDLDGIRITKPRGTYLLWIDYRESGLSEKEMFERLLHVGKLGLDPGKKFGVEGEGFMRMNIAVPRATVEEAVRRLHIALQAK